MVSWLEHGAAFLSGGEAANDRDPQYQEPDKNLRSPNREPRHGCKTNWPDLTCGFVLLWESKRARQRTCRSTCFMYLWRQSVVRDEEPTEGSRSTPDHSLGCLRLLMRRCLYDGSLQRDQRRQVIMLPGGVLPAEVAYKDLIQLLGPQTNVVAKELEIYSTPTPPKGFNLDLEVAGILRAADGANFERFHLLGYSAGGASTLAFTAAHPERLLSLALAEPAWDGAQGLSDAELAVWHEFGRVMELPEDQRLSGFVRNQLRPGVSPPPPPPGPSPPWMAQRPAALAAFVHVFRTAKLDRDRLRSFDRPVYFALGGLSNPDYYERMSKRLAEVFRDFTVEVYPERHHFDPPHRVEPERFAAALKRLWTRAESGQPTT